MIKVESLSIKHFRGIHDLTITPDARNFAICGPNGTGKSGVVDALEFALTGSVTRLTGQGMAGVSLKLHGPHVDLRDNPKKALVILKAFIPALNKSVTVERRVDTPNEPLLSPNSADVRGFITELARHPEFALSRREIIKYVIASPGDRSKEVQALLRLDRVEKIRQNLQSVVNSCKTSQKQAEQAQKDAQTALARALGLPALTKESLLGAVNARRATLGLEVLTDLGADTSLKSGLGAGAAPSTKQKIIKSQALADIAALAEEISGDEPLPVKDSRAETSHILRELIDSPTLLRSLRREAFLRTGLDLFEDDQCPYCDNEWDLAELRAHIEARLAEASEAVVMKHSLERAALPLLEALRKLEVLLSTAAIHAQNLPSPINGVPLLNLAADLKRRRERILSLDAIDNSVKLLSADYRPSPQEVKDTLTLIKSGVDALPDPSQEDEARDFLTLCQERLDVYRETRRQLERAKQDCTLAAKVIDAYSASSTAVLTKIYSDVEKDFTEYYRFVNRDDESAFQGKLTPSLGKLGFDVDFYGRGLFPPGAYHSEGHQDGMGLCLYLALMKHTLGEDFTFAVLDDVMMSVDSGHRREICALLKARFAKTQFLITTHDSVWLQHMTTEQMISPKSSIHFRKWTVEDGPAVWEGGEVWDEIEHDLEANDVLAAATTLRRYLEYASGLLAHKLRATTEHRGDGQYELGDLLPAVIGAWKKLLASAREAAQSWKQKEENARLTHRQTDFGGKVAQSNVEQWAINKSIHYNEWAQLSKEEFRPVVQAFRGLIESFRCDACGSLLYVSPSRGPKESIRCDCGGFSVNLKKKPGALATGAPQS